MAWWPRPRPSSARAPPPLSLRHIYPTYTISAQQATKGVPIKPGTDPALGMAMLNAIIANEWYDLYFMRERTCAPLLVREDNGHFPVSYTHLDVYKRQLPLRAAARGPRARAGSRG